jgi:mannose-6-phosphate isomerase-like protein (cupin superfamily)
MADYAKKNIMELDNMAEQFGLAPNLEARFGRKALDGEKGGFSYQRLAPNFRLPFGHYHGAQEETYVIVEGSGRMKLEDDVIDIKQWDAIRVAPKTKRSFEAGADGLTFLAFGAGESGDAETLQDFWPAD